MASKRAQVLVWMDEARALEEQIRALSTGGGGGGGGAQAAAARVGERLVDDEGFPRADLDVHGIRIARHELARLQTDHKQLMKNIEDAMFQIHAEAKQQRPQQSSSSSTSTPSTRPNAAAAPSASPPPTTTQPVASTATEGTTSTAPLTTSATSTSTTTSSPSRVLTVADAFYLVDQVFEDSPANVAGLRIGDKIIELGTVNRFNHTKDNMRQAVLSNTGRRMRVSVYRVGEGMLELFLIPQPWSGQGLLGCHLTELSESDRSNSGGPLVGTRAPGVPPSSS